VSAVSDRRRAVQPGHGANEQSGPGGRPGRLVAVAGLCGGAGASTLAYLLCAAAVADAQRGVLCIDATGRAGIAAYARTRAGISFAHASIELEGGRMPDPDHLLATSRDGVRVLCGRSSLEQPLLAVNGALRLLADARAAHALTVIDCGTLTGEHERLALHTARTVLLVTPATASGIERSAPLAVRARELCCADATLVLVARADRRERKAPVARLASVAEELGATVVLCPHIDDLRERPVADALDRAQVTLQTLRGAIAR
jgi:MinD-like ATPase involved in chromosome partitioning or flagellar assembly